MDSFRVLFNQRQFGRMCLVCRRVYAMDNPNPNVRRVYWLNHQLEYQRDANSARTSVSAKYVPAKHGWKLNRRFDSVIYDYSTKAGRHAGTDEKMDPYESKWVNVKKVNVDIESSVPKYRQNLPTTSAATEYQRLSEQATKSRAEYLATKNAYSETAFDLNANEKDSKLPGKSDGEDSKPVDGLSNKDDDGNIKEILKPDTKSIDEELAGMSLYQRYKTMLKNYWYVFIPVHFVTSCAWFGCFYYLAVSGFDVVPFLEKFPIPEIIMNQVKNSPALGNIAVAFALYKLVTPARYMLTIGLTVPTIKHLVRRGTIRPKPIYTRAQIKDAFKEKVLKKR